MTNLKTKIDQMAKLESKLSKSLLLQSIAPGAFKAGKARAQVIGNLRFEPHKARFVIRDDTRKIVADLLLDDVPRELWPEQVIHEYGLRHRDKRP